MATSRFGWRGHGGYRPTDADSSTPDWAYTSTDNNFGAVASIIADRSLLNSAKQEQGYRSSGIPGWLTQADVLQVSPEPTDHL